MILSRERELTVGTGCFDGDRGSSSVSVGGGSKDEGRGDREASSELEGGAAVAQVTAWQ